MIYKNDYDQVIKVKTENESDIHEITFNKGGDNLIIRIGNTVIDVMQGYNNSGLREPCAFITFYAYDDKKPSRVHVTDDRTVILSR